MPDAISISTGVVDGDMPCMQCGYNLRTLSRAGVCTECGTPVARTIAQLERFGRLHLNRVFHGAMLLTIALFLQTAQYLGPSSISVGFASALASAILLLSGIIMMARCMPAGPFDRMTRGLCIAFGIYQIFCLLVAAIFSYFGPRISLMPNQVFLLINAALLVEFIGLAVVCFISFYFFRDIAQTLHLRWLARLTTTVFAILFGVYLIASLDALHTTLIGFADISHSPLWKGWAPHMFAWLPPMGFSSTLRWFNAIHLVYWPTLAIVARRMGRRAATAV